MGASQTNRSALAYRQALQHPVFLQASTMSRRNGTANGTTPSPRADDPGCAADFCTAERSSALESMLSFFDVARRCWADIAPAHAPELAIMADLYINEHRCRPVAVGDACLAARVPCTSALRAIDRLIAGGMLVRYGDPRDSRRKLLALTDRSRRLMARFSDNLAHKRSGSAD